MYIYSRLFSWLVYIERTVYRHITPHTVLYCIPYCWQCMALLFTTVTPPLSVHVGIKAHVLFQAYVCSNGTPRQVSIYHSNRLCTIALSDWYYLVSIIVLYRASQECRHPLRCAPGVPNIPVLWLCRWCCYNGSCIVVITTVTCWKLSPRVTSASRMSIPK